MRNTVRIHTVCLILVLCLSACASSNRVEPIAPLYQAALAGTYDSTQTKSDVFELAMSTNSPGQAIELWQKYLSNSAQQELGDGYEAIRENVAKFELARLYYLTGQVAAADVLMLELDPLQLR